LKELGPLDYPEGNLLCIPKLILIVAFRTGQLEANVEATLQTMVQRQPQNSVQLPVPEYRLIYMVDHHRVYLDQYSKRSMLCIYTLAEKLP
jgi:hypothetical protein